MSLFLGNLLPVFWVVADDRASDILGLIFIGVVSVCAFACKHQVRLVFLRWICCVSPLNSASTVGTQFAVSFDRPPARASSTRASAPFSSIPARCVRVGFLATSARGGVAGLGIAARRGATQIFQNGIYHIFRACFVVSSAASWTAFGSFYSTMDSAGGT